MPRKHFEWKFRDKTLQLGERTLIVGVLNLTPDSFSDGGRYDDPDRAFAHALNLEEQGADIIDIGAESTRPGAARISEAEELRRLVPVLKRLKNKLTIPLSIDTYKSGVALKALELGADIINDPSGLTFDPEITKAVLQHDAGLIINHMRGTPETWAKLPPLKNALATIALELEAAAHRATRGGVERRRIVIDPGLGFGKRKEQNSEILGRLEQLASLEYPILVGPSRKHFLAKESLSDTEFATAGAVAAAILYGAHLVRVHDVKAMKSVAEVADEIARARSQAVIETTGVVREQFAVRSLRQDAEPARPSRGPNRPPLNRPAMDRPVLDSPAPDHAVLNRPGVDRPVIDHAVLNRPVVESPTTDHAVMNRPAIEGPAIVRTPIMEPALEGQLGEHAAFDQPRSVGSLTGGRASTSERSAAKSFSKPASSKSGFAKGGPSKSGSGRPSSGRPSSGRPSSGRPSSDRPSYGRSDAGRQDTRRPESGRAGSERPSSGRPSTGKPGFSKPGFSKTGMGNATSKPYDKRSGKRDGAPPERRSFRPPPKPKSS